jgi:AcrR family transcriptional regulator
MNNEIENIEKDTTSAEERILEAAVEIFAEKGYDAAGVDEIAKRANVTKPLIYYYFKGKQTILDESIKRFMKKVIQEKTQYIGIMSAISKETLYKGLDEKMAMFEKNNKILKVIAMELLKEKPAGESIFNMVKPMFDIAIPRFEEMGFDVKDRMDLLITSYFFGMAPTLMFFLFRDMFCEFHQIEKAELDSKFASIVKSLYIDYFINHFGDNMK